MKEGETVSLPKISVIVPVYNVEKYLSRCIDSILAQTFGDYEVILVDDGSTDRSGKICDEYAEKDPRFRVIHKENGGLSDARNTGVSAAVGDFVCFIDSDDFIDPEMLSVLLSLTETTGAEVAICGIRNCYESGQTEQSSADETFLCDGVEGLRLTLEGKKLPGSVCTKLISRPLAQSLFFRVGKTYEDAFYTPDLFLKTPKIAATTRSYYNYWHRADSITTKPFSEKSMDAVSAYEYTLEQVLQHCPALEDVARFRLCWAYFVTLDRLMVTPGYRKNPYFKPVVSYLRRHRNTVLHSPYFRKSRKLAMVALSVNVGLYRLLSLANDRKNGVHA